MPLPPLPRCLCRECHDKRAALGWPQPEPPKSERPPRLGQLALDLTV